MIKKFITVLLTGIISFSSMRVEAYADSKYKRNIINGNADQISLQLNKEVFKNANEAILINEEAIIDSISATPLAYSKDAPIIPIKSKGIDKEVEEYLDELGVKKITIIGSSESISQVTANNLKKLGYDVTRIYGKDRYETSIKIADELEDIKELNNIILINYNVGFENALGIYSFAAEENMPIIWVDNKKLNDIKYYIKENKIKKVYAIGDSEDFNESLKSNIDNIEIIKNINSIKGNLNIIDKFKENKTDKIYTINLQYGNYVDINKYISLGVVAAKQDIPILICTESLTKSQEQYLDENNIKTLEQVGSEVKDYSLKDIIFSKKFLSTIALILLLIIIFIRVFLNQ